MDKGSHKVTWDALATKVFCEVCKEEVIAGNRPLGCLSNQGYKNLVQKFFVKTGRNYVKKQFKNKWDSLKKEYGYWVELKHAATGLGWDDKLGTVIADDELWTLYIQGHPEAAKYRYGPPAHEAELTVMFDKAHVTGASSAIPGQVLEDHGKLVVTDVESSTDKDVEIMEERLKKEKRPMPSSGPSHPKKHKEEKSPIVREFKKMVSIMGSGTSITSTNTNQVGAAPGIKEILRLVVRCGATEGSDLHFTATKILMKPDYRELFASLETDVGRLNWLERMHNELNKK